MRELLEKFFPILSGNNTVVEKTWNLYDVMNLFEFWIFLLIKAIIGTCLSFTLEVLKFILILLLTYAFALGVFNFMDSVYQGGGYKPTIKKNRSEPQEIYPYMVDYLSEEEQPKAKSPNEATRMNGFESTSNSAIVHMGSFKRPSNGAEGGEISTIGRAIEDLKNAHTTLNENRASIVESNQSRESRTSKSSEARSSTGT